MIPLRPAQEDILEYQGGMMGISAVPGSGKTWTLSLLAARMLAEGWLQDDQEILIVTLANSAVDNFNQRITQFIQNEFRLFPGVGYRVRTLHGLANDIVRERPTLVGLSDRFQIVDERESQRILREVSQAWLRSNPGGLDSYLKEDLDEYQGGRVQRDHLPKLVQDIANSFIRSAKDLCLTPERLAVQMEQAGGMLPLAQMGLELYHDYQRSLTYREGVDFDDLIWMALRAMQLDERLLESLQSRWPFILEDEAQDSSRLQNEILKLLAGESGNWVRVGDPNQAIYETFTTANPSYLIDFIDREQVVSRELPNSGRSTASIMFLANQLVAWSRQDHPVDEVRSALQPTFIEPAPEGDPSPNPEDQPDQVYLVRKRYTSQEELGAVAGSLAKWLPDHPQATVAALAANNEHAIKLVDELQKRGLPYEDSLLRSSSATRASAGVIRSVLDYLSLPHSAAKLAGVYQAWRRADGEDDTARQQVLQVARALEKLSRVEDFLWPGLEGDWLETSVRSQDAQVYEQLLEFRELVRRWQGAVVLPVDQMVLMLAQDLLFEASELAVAHKLAWLLRRASRVNQTWRLPELTRELDAIAQNERRFLGFSDSDTGFDPEKHKGKVVVATIHKAKGLEWDRVYLMSTNTYDFPSGLGREQFIAEKWFIRDELNLQAETLEQLKWATESDPYGWYVEGEASQQARLDYVRERLRLLYVGITRAKKELVITFNTGRDGKQQPAVAFAALQGFWQERQENMAGTSPTGGEADVDPS